MNILKIVIVLVMTIIVTPLFGFEISVRAEEKPLTPYEIERVFLQEVYPFFSSPKGGKELIVRAVGLLQLVDVWNAEASAYFLEAVLQADEIIDEILSVYVKDARPPIQAWGCWHMGLTKFYRLIATLRTPNQNGRGFDKKSIQEIETEFDQIIRYYKCAIDGFDTIESYSFFGGIENAKKHGDAVRKLLAFTDKQKEKVGEESNKSKPLDDESESELMESVLQSSGVDIIEDEKKGKKISPQIIPIPNKDSPPTKGYSPGGDQSVD